MQLFKKFRFWLVWLLAVPFVLLYLVLAALGSDQWSLIWHKLLLIEMSLYQKYINNM